jgi:hypothetical protein
VAKLLDKDAGFTINGKSVEDVLKQSPKQTEQTGLKIEPAPAPASVQNEDKQKKVSFKVPEEDTSKAKPPESQTGGDKKRLREENPQLEGQALKRSGNRV